MPLTSGTRLGPYEIVAPIGAGGMGEVYRARDTKLNRDVALKILPHAFAADPDRLARFKREAQMLASLNHPNIAQIHGFEDSSTQALVMELVEGPTLADRIAQGPIAPADALPIAKQVADALEAAHEQGIVHRDLKPANVKVRDDGTVKVLDFGLAKAMAPDGDGAPANSANSPTLTTPAMTAMGMILGTAAYMSPEQAKGRAVDRRADIWAFGVVLYEMLTGRPLFAGDSVAETIGLAATRDPDWTWLSASTPPRLRELMRDCLVRDPKQRVRDIGDARRVIDQLISGAPDVAAASPPIHSGAPRAWRNRVLPWAIAGAAALAAAVMAWVQFGSTVAAPPANPVTRARMDLKQLAGLVNLSRDGRRVVYNSGGQAGSLLAMRELDQFDSKPVPGAADAIYPIFSPDAEWIAYSGAGGKIKKIPIAGGAPTTLCDGSLERGAAWGDDNTIVFSGGRGLLRVPASGGKPETLTTVDTSKGEAGHRQPQLLPDGRLLFTVTKTAAGERPEFAVLDLKKGGYRTVAPGGNGGRYAASGRGSLIHAERETGHLTFVRGDTLFAVPFDLGRLAVTGPEATVIDAVSTYGPPGFADYSFSDDGLLVYSESFTQQGTTLAWANRQGVVQQIPGQIQRKWGSGRLSPDGLRVANAILGDKGTDIWVADLVRATQIRLTFSGDNGERPIWTPDGLRIVYQGAVDGKAGIYSVAADGSGRPNLILASDGKPQPSTFTPDGKTLLYTQTADGRPRIFVLPPPSVAGAPRQPHPLHDASGGESEAEVSPDGRWVAFSSSETGASEVYVVPFPGPGAKTPISTKGGVQPRWTRTGRELIYWDNELGGGVFMSTAIQSGPALQVGATHRVFQLAVGSTWDISPDGTRFLIEQRRLGGGTILAIITNWFDELRRRAPAKK